MNRQFLTLAVVWVLLRPAYVVLAAERDAATTRPLMAPQSICFNASRDGQPFDNFVLAIKPFKRVPLRTEVVAFYSVVGESLSGGGTDLAGSGHIQGNDFHVSLAS